MDEMGELAMHQSVGWKAFTPGQEEYDRAEEEFRRLDLDRIRAVVSQYAKASHSEFVAEVFAALMLGRDELRQDKLVMRTYERFAGPRLVRWTET